MTDMTAEERLLAVRYLREMGVTVTKLRLENRVRQMRERSAR